MHRVRRLILLLPLLLASCGGRAPEPTAAPQAARLVPEDTPAPAKTISPTATHSPTPAPSPTPPPSPTAMPLPTATAAPPPPQLVWLPYGAGSYGEPILIQANEVPAFLPAPINIEIFFDYDPANGRIAYGDVFWEAAENEVDAITDLWVYDYATDVATQWLETDVGRVEWAPPGVEPATLAVAEHNGETFDLVLLQEPAAAGTAIDPLAENISPFYSWSPAGNAIAFVRDWELFVVDITSGEESGPLAEGVYELTGWVGDKPLWDLEHGYLIFADDPFTFVALDGTEVFSPQDLDETPFEGERPLKMLWSAEMRQLIAQTEGMGGNNIQIYLLSEDLHFVTDTYFLENSLLVDWYVAEESIIVLDEAGEPKIWSLLTYEFVEP